MYIMIANITNELLTEGIVTLVVGMSIVFATLLILVFILEASGKFFESLAEKNKKKASLVQNNKHPEEGIIEATRDLELIAVITAAIAINMDIEPNNLKVRSIKRIDNNWRSSGIVERLYN